MTSWHLQLKKQWYNQFKNWLKYSRAGPTVLVATAYLLFIVIVIVIAIVARPTDAYLGF